MKRTIFTKEIGTISFVYTLFLAFGILCLMTSSYRLMGAIITVFALLLLLVRVFSWTEVS